MNNETCNSIAIGNGAHAIGRSVMTFKSEMGEVMLTTERVVYINGVKTDLDPYPFIIIKNAIHSVQHLIQPREGWRTP